MPRGLFDGEYLKKVGEPTPEAAAELRDRIPNVDRPWLFERIYTADHGPMFLIAVPIAVWVGLPVWWKQSHENIPTWFGWLTFLIGATAGIVVMWWFNQQLGEEEDRVIDLTEAYQHGAGPLLGYCDGGGIRSPFYVRAGDDHHVLVIGPPGSGKTTRGIAPAIYAHPGPAVCTSTRDDVLQEVIRDRSRQGVIWLYDPTGRNPVHPALAPHVTPLRWSPLRSSGHWNEARLLAKELVDVVIRRKPQQSSHWGDRAQNMLGGLLHAAALNDSDVTQVMEWLVDRHTAGSDVIGEVSAILLAQSDDPIGAGNSWNLAQLAGETEELPGILSTCSRVLDTYSTSAALATAINPNFDPERFIRSQDTIFLIADPGDSELVAPLNVGLIYDIIHALYRYRQQNGHAVSLPVLFALDELANMAPISNLNGIVSDGRANGIRLLAGIQDRNQITHKYGPAVADQLLTIFRTIVLYPGIRDTQLLGTLAHLGGRYEEWYEEKGESKSRNLTDLRRHRQESTHERRERRENIEPNQLSAMHRGTVFVQRDSEYGYLSVGDVEFYRQNFAS